VQGAVISPNEARNLEGFDSVPYGDEPRCQMQVVPLSAAGSIPAAPGPEAPAAPAVAKNYKAAVQSDVEALRARVKRPGIAGPRELPKGYVAAPPGIIRKVRDDALQG
jgi:hypothetical protein